MTSITAFGLSPMGTSGGEQLLICPFHNDRSPSAWWNPIKDVFYCAVCGYGLSARQLAQKLGLNPDDFAEEEEEFGSELFDYDLTEIDVDYMDTIIQYDEYPDYMQERNISREAMKLMKVGMLHSLTASSHAIHFNMTTVLGRRTGYVHRLILGSRDGRRYQKVGKMQPLWPAERLATMPVAIPFLVFEGPFSAMRNTSYWLEKGIETNSFAMMGAHYNIGLVDMVRNLKPIFLYDHDKAGINACYQMRKILPSAPSFTLPISVDDMDDKQIENMHLKLMRKLEEEND